MNVYQQVVDFNIMFIKSIETSQGYGRNKVGEVRVR